MGKKKALADHRADTRGGRWIGIPHCVVESEAYRHLTPMDRAVLIEIVAKFNGYNNGKIAISYRQLAGRLNRKNEAPFAASIARLINHGLLDIESDASWKDRRAREYRLTFVSTTGVGGRFVPASNEYLHWVPEEKSSTTDVVVERRGSATTPVAARGLLTSTSVVAYTQNWDSAAARLLPMS